MTDVSKRPSESPDLEALSGLAPELARTFVSVASDIALVIDGGGVIRDVALGTDPLTPGASAWVGRPWAETVTGETRLKVEQLLSEVRAAGVTRRREVNHLAQGGADIPVAYAAIRLGRDGPVLAVGRDLRVVAAIQQRFIEAQQEMERDYWRQRQAESRYQLLFQVATDAVMVVDANTLHIIEANRAAAQLFGSSSESMIGRSPAIGVAMAARPGVEEMLVTARASGRPAEIRALMPQRRGTVGMSIDISATPFRADDSMLLLVRARAVESANGPLMARGEHLSDFVERTPDAVVITDSSGRVLMANPAFDTLCGRAGASPAHDHLLDEVLGDPMRELARILAEARRVGIAEKKGATVLGSDGQAIEVEVSAALLAEGDQECVGLILRRTEQRRPRVPPQIKKLAAQIDQLAAQVGLQGLDALLRQAGDIAERHLIREALARAAGQLPATAQTLGLDLPVLIQRMGRLGIDPDDLDLADAAPLTT